MASERSIRVGQVAIGGGAPVVLQSMTLTPTRDVQATIAQIAALADAGCEVVRCAVPKTEDAEALRMIVRLSPLPVIADIHFNASLALKAIDARDKKELFAKLGDVDKACESCHLHYWYPNDKRARDAAREDGIVD